MDARVTRSRMTILSALAICCLGSSAAAARTPAAQAPAGTAILDVTVVDAAGDPVSNATVALSGVVDRKAMSDAAGMVSFLDVPAGRYDLVASMGAAARSAPRLLDVEPFTTTPVSITMKPVTLRGGMMACGGFDPATLASLASTAHHVVHVTVRSQRTLEDPMPPDAQQTFPRTMNMVEVRRVFKSDPGKPRIGNWLLVEQGGGRIDRGDHVDVYPFNGLPPLNVGDDYVLFLYASDGRAPVIHGSEEGAFRIRNGLVEPAGRAGAAEAWKRRPASEFFDALRTSIGDSRSRIQDSRSRIQDSRSRIQDPR